MQHNYEEEYFEEEENNPWFVKRRELIFDLISKFSRNTRIIDYGCGSGQMLQYLETKGFKNLDGFEVSSYFIKNRKTKAKIYCAKADIKNRRYDVILVLDVIEHIRDDRKTLEEIGKLLAFGGTVIISVPAFMALWSQHDIVNKHFRRYDTRMLTKILPPGMQIKRKFFWNFFLFVPTAFVKIVKRNNRKKVTSDLSSMSPLASLIFKFFLGLENKLLKVGVNLPFGTSLFFILKKTK